MKKLLLVCFLIQLSSAYLLAQSNTKCPSVSVIGSSSTARIGESVTFTTNISDVTQLKNVEYLWSVSAGQIAEGQGTRVIRVLTDNNMGNTTITATVEIKGFPANCASVFSVNADILYACVLPLKIDEYSAMPFAKEKMRLDYVASELKSQKDTGLVFVMFYSKKTNQAYIRNRIAKIKSYLIKAHSLSEKDMKFVMDGESENPHTSIYLQPIEFLKDFEPIGENQN